MDDETREQDSSLRWLFVVDGIREGKSIKEMDWVCIPLAGSLPGSFVTQDAPIFGRMGHLRPCKGGIWKRLGGCRAWVVFKDGIPTPYTGEHWEQALQVYMRIPFDHRVTIE